MTTAKIDAPTVRRALLCLSDDDVRAAVQTPVYGEPLLFHLIKNLQDAGIEEIAIAVETVQPDLMALIDFLRGPKLELKLLRDGPDALDFAARPGMTLLQNAAVWASSELLGQLVKQPANLILTVPEDPRFDRFERIDLSRRWAGLALLDGALVRKSGPIPEGWSIDSTLLRAALQVSCPDRSLEPAEAQKMLVHARSEDGVERLSRSIAQLPGEIGFADRFLVKAADFAVRTFGSHRWWRITAEWTFPVFAAAAVIAAIFGYVATALWLGFVAVVARTIRTRSREVRYRKSAGDVVDIAAMAILLAALFFTLKADLFPFDAAFLSAAIFSLVFVVARSPAAMFGHQISSAVVALMLALFGVFGLSVVAVKLAIALLIASLFAGTLQKES